MPTRLTDPLPGFEARPGGGRYAVLDQGAHVLAWQPPGSRPVLWTSARSAFAAGVAVRGGVPIVFPWFGAGPDGTRSPAHGYARTSTWDLAGVDEDGDRLRVRYRLDGHAGDDPYGPSPTVELSADFAPAELAIRLAVTNDTGGLVTVEAALHTYLAVSDIRQVWVDGFDGCGFRDSVAGADPGPHLQHGPIRFAGETDRLYAHAGAAVLRDPGWDRTITVAKQGSGTTVVWNPWAGKAGRMADFGDDEWPGMVCIEAAAVRGTALTLAPGASHTLAQMITVGGFS
ncbi:MAG: D-hexose-6-phosphate mutarotase [Propionicimonas sp.]|nr:D-hexose-6-phosphate mutarotase [Propionicimonas sp.]